MIYVDSSVVIAFLLSEEMAPPEAFWKEHLLSSRLTAYEVRRQLQNRGLASVLQEVTDQILGGISLIELVEPVVDRATDSFPGPLRTLDALHLASALFLRDMGADVTVATYDRRMAEAARALDFKVVVP